MKFVPYKDPKANGYFCPGIHRNTGRDTGCAECGAPENYRHLMIGDQPDGSDRVALCRQCYEDYATFVGLEEIVP